MARGVGGKGPANIMEHLKGVHFPLSKQAILDHAQGAPGPDTEEVVSVLQRIDDHDYASPAEVLQEVGKIE